MMKRNTVWIVIAIILAGIVLLKLSVFKKKDYAEAKIGNKAGGMQPSLVRGFVLRPVTLDNQMQAIGTIVSNEMVELKSEASGKIVKLNFTEGEFVHAGKLLVKINDQDLQAQLKKMEALLKLASLKVERLKDLRKIEGVSQEELDIAITEIESIQADKDNISALIAKTEIRAPFSGKIGVKNVSLGSYLSPVVIVAKLQQLSPIKVDFTLPQKYANKIKVGNKVSFSIEGNEKLFSAVVSMIDPDIDIATRTVRVRAITANPDGVLYPGGFVNVDVDLGTLQNTIMVPTESLVPILKGKKIFVAENGIAKEIIVETGIRNDKMIEVFSPELSVGDTVIYKGIMGLKAGSSLNFKSIE